MKKVDDKFSETLFTVAVVFCFTVIIMQILLTTITGIINLFQ
jgi:hypothetical protein